MLRKATASMSRSDAARGRPGLAIGAVVGTVVATVAAVLLPAGTPAGADARSAGDGEIVGTDSGPVRGTVSAEYRTFQGIPYAAPPVGDLRWRSPQPPRPWSQPRDATRPGNVCAQNPGGGYPDTDEDCLYLNVTTPRGTPDDRLRPVMVWVHGAGNSYGYGGDYLAHRLAVQGDVVVVTFNYRLGVFGFLAHPALPDSGAFGFEDQQAALRWVQRNARAFGGDPGTVTLFGESGGAFDVCGQLTSPGSRGLFHRAVMQSGSCASTWPENGIVYDEPASSPWIPQADAAAAGVARAAALGCPDPATAAGLACLRRVPAAELAAGPASLTTVAYGNRVLPQRPDRALVAGRFHRVPVISGTTRDEGRLAAAYSPHPFTEEQYQRLLVDAFGDRAARVAATYPSAAHGSPALAWGAVLTDRVWACPQLTDDRQLARRTPVYAFEFADRQAPTGYFEFPPGLPPGAFHAADLAYVFDVVGFEAEFTPEQERLADQMIRYWTRFAATGDPNGHGSPSWERFRGSSVQSLAPGDGGIRPVNLDAEHKCRFWAALE
jgi:para-nitrobenzyl esterase